MNKTIPFLLVLISSMCLSISCNKSKVSDTNSEEIIGYKWSRDPDLKADGTHLEILRPQGVDHYEHYAFNADSTVDFWHEGDFMTGTFSMDGNLVTCLFKINGGDSAAMSTDGKYNSKIILEYRDKHLFLYDEQIRTPNDKWVSTVDGNYKQNYKKLYYSKEDQYLNKKYSIHDFLGMIEEYDTTANALAVVERYNCRWETPYKNGKRDGTFKQYRNGKLIIFGTYNDGIPTGEWYFFSELGFLESKISNIRIAIEENEHGKKYMADITEYPRFESSPNVYKLYFNHIDGGWYVDRSR